MTVWAVILVPLAVLPIVLLFRFIGCGFDGVATGDFPPLPERTPEYAKTVRAETSVIAYWRLVDGASAVTAVDEIGLRDKKTGRDGEYRVGPGLSDEKPEAFGPGTPGSEGPTGGFGSESPSALITLDPTAKCRFFQGGHVRVPDTLGGLYTDEFTIEAWIKGGVWGQTAGYHHELFSAGGRFAITGDPSPRFHGFEVFANGDGRLEAQVLGTNVAYDPSIPLAIVVPGLPTHVAVILKKKVGDPFSKILMIYSNGKLAGSGTVGAYSPPKGAPLFIGVGKRTADTADISEPRFPVKSHIQEVVLHNRALSQEEIQNHVKLNR